MKKIYLIIIASMLTFVSYSQVSFVIKSETYTRPDTVVFINTTSTSTSQQWVIPGGKVSNANDYIQPEITVVYDKPGYYSAKLIVQDENLKIDSLEIENIVAAPGIIEKDTVFCLSDTLKFTATGGKFYRWENEYTDSSYVNFSPNSGYYVVKISKDNDFVVSMKDSVKLTIASKPVLPLDTKYYCMGDSISLKFSENVVNYKLKKLIYYGSLFITATDVSGIFSNLDPYYCKKPEQIDIEYTDNLNCIWHESNYSIGQYNVSYPTVNVASISICKGSEFTLNAGTNADNKIEWYKDDQIVGSGIDFYGTDIGRYIVKVTDVSNTCTTKDTVLVSYQSVISDSLTSINFLPGIGYVSTYSKDYSNYPLILKSNATVVATVKSDDLYSYAKLPLLIDTMSYQDAPIYTLEGQNSCGEKVVSNHVSPMKLSVDYDFNNEGNVLEWTPYTFKKIYTYYIFRGTSPDKMELLTEYAAGGVLRYTDIHPPKGVIYAIGVKDEDLVSSNYKAMQPDWQVGYLSSNYSPDTFAYKKIGVFAYLQNDKPGSNVYFSSYAPNVDSIIWHLETSYFDEMSNSFFYTAKGDKIEYNYPQKGLYDVKVTTYSKNGNDSIYLKDFINIGEPILFAIDTIYKTVGNDSLSINISKTIRNDVAFLNPKSKVIWQVPTQNNNRILIKQNYNNKFPNNSDSLLIWVNPVVGDTVIKTTISGYFIDSYYPSAEITIIVSNKPNEAPQLIKEIPEQIADYGKTFKPIYLPEYVKDDYSLFSNLHISTSESPIFELTYLNGFLYIEQKNGDFKGTEKISLTITDESNKSLQLSVDLTQPNLINVPKSLPSATFSANKQFISPLGIVKFTVRSQSADSLFWDFDGAKQIDGTVINPVDQFNNPGKYTISLIAKNAIGSTIVKKQNYINVTAISPNDTTICKGDSVNISIISDGFNSFIWSNNKTTKSIKVAPSKTTTYTVTMTSGITKVVESVVIAIPDQPKLGNDTTFCEGSSMKFNPGNFKKYYWNDASESGNAEFTTKQQGKITVKTIDSLGCIAYDTVTIAPLYKKPVVALGKDTTFCWKKKLILDANNTTSVYLWNTGEKTKTLEVDTTGQYSVTVTNEKLCVNSDTINIKVIVPFVPHIGIITQSSTQKNIIAWEPDLNKDIKQYNIWRENSSKSYEKIKTININDSTYFIDQTSMPKTQLYRYAISTVDKTCNNESYLSPIHSSLYLTCKIQKDGSVEALWNNYQGITVTNYILYRAEKGKPLQKYVVVPADKGETTRYIDTKAIGLNSYYQVGFDLSSDINPSKLKSDSGPFSQSLSNLAESELSDEPELTNETVHIIPNPASTKAIVQTSSKSNVQVSVIDEMGKVLQTNIGCNAIEIDCSTMSPGIYLIKIQSDEEVMVKTLIVK